MRDGSRQGSPPRRRKHRSQIRGPHARSAPGGPMPRTRTFLALSAVMLAGTAATSFAAPKACNLTSDAPGDPTRYPVRGPAGPNNATLDIKTVDVASNAKQLTTVVRVERL